MRNARGPRTGPSAFILRGSVFLMGIINSFQLSQVLFLPGHSAPRQIASITRGPFPNQHTGPWDKIAYVPQCPSSIFFEKNSKNIPFL